MGRHDQILHLFFYTLMGQNGAACGSHRQLSRQRHSQLVR